MCVNLPISFPSEAEQFRQQAELTRAMTPGQRILAVLDLLAVAETLSRSGGHWEAQLAYHAQCEREWQDRMKEFIAAHALAPSR
jgi:hypothetical protein